MSFVRSFLSLRALVCSWSKLMSSSTLMAGLPSFRHPFCMVDFAGFHLEMSFAHRPSWCSAIILARILYIWLDPVCCQHVVFLVGLRALCSQTSGFSSSSNSSCANSLRLRCFLLDRSGLVGWPRSCFPPFTVRVVWFINGDFVDGRSVRSCGTLGDFSSSA